MTLRVGKKPFSRFSTDGTVQRPHLAGETHEEDGVDTVGFARWVDEDELEELGDNEDVDSESDSDPGDKSEDEREVSEDKGEVPIPKGKEKARPEWRTKVQKDRKHRISKHAPIEVTSKRPVTRRRTVVDIQPIQSRDPRFLPLAGELSVAKFQQQYGFLTDVHENELKTLREHAKRARVLVKTAPNDLREEWERELGRLQLAMKRAESAVNRDKKSKIEQEALSKITKEEHEKRKKGKRSWWMKESDKSSLLARARYDAIVASGGKRAVKKAIEKRQRNISNRQKKLGHSARPGLTRPFPEHDDGVKKRRKIVD